MYRSSDPLSTGNMFGPYQIIHKIGHGGMATIYRAYQPAMDRDVAIKVLPQEFVGDKEFYARFVQEARLIAKIEHPHILPVYDFGEVDGMPYLVMRYLDWGTLKDFLNKQPLAIKTIDRIFTQLARALGHAHGMGVIHRDIKPSNVLVDQYGNVFLTDFGIAKLVESTTKFTPTGALTGTPAYVSPEQARGESQPDFRTDIYSLGVILYEMFTGRLPFEAETTVAMLMMKVSEPPTPPSKINADIPSPIEIVILKALAQNPAERYQSMKEFLDAWREALAAIGETSIDSPDEDWDSPPGVADVGKITPDGSAAADRRRKGKRQGIPHWGWIGAAIILIILAAGAFLYGNSPSLIPLQRALALPFIREITGGALPGPTNAAITPAGGTTIPFSSATDTPLPPTATVTAAPRPTQNDPTSTPSVIRRSFGPISGILPHGGQNRVQQVFSRLNERDFVAKATFNNPYSGGMNIWDIYMFFRSPDGKEGYRLVVRSDERWELLDHRQVGLEARVIPIAFGNLVGLNPRSDGSNTIGLIVIENKGFFFLNDNFMARLDLSKRVEAGDIAIGTGFSPNSQVPGEQTRYIDFTIWSISPFFGPANGNLVHSGLGEPVAFNVDADLWNFVAMARVTNPYPSAMSAWSEGFAFRSNGVEDQYRVFAKSDSTIQFGEIKPEYTTWISQSEPANLKLAQGDRNDLILLAWGDQGLFFVNGMWVAKLDLSSRKYPGDVAVGTGFYGSDQIKGKEMLFEDFTIWELP